MILDGILTLQPFTSDILLSLAERQSILTGQCFGDGCRLAVVAVARDGVAVVVNTIIDNMHMRVRLVLVPEYDELGVHDTHPSHVLTGNLFNLLAGELMKVLWRERQRYVADTQLDIRTCLWR